MELEKKIKDIIERLSVIDERLNKLEVLANGLERDFDILYLERR